MAAGGRYEWKKAAIWRGGSRRPPVRSWGTRWPQDSQHSGMLQPPQQELERHAPHVHAQTRPG